MGKDTSISNTMGISIMVAIVIAALVLMVTTMGFTDSLDSNVEVDSSVVLEITDDKRVLVEPITQGENLEVKVNGRVVERIP